jgi:hypothetical protein
MSRATESSERTFNPVVELNQLEGHISFLMDEKFHMSQAGWIEKELKQSLFDKERLQAEINKKEAEAKKHAATVKTIAYLYASLDPAHQADVTELIGLGSSKVVDQPEPINLGDLAREDEYTFEMEDPEDSRIGTPVLAPIVNINEDKRVEEEFPGLFNLAQKDDTKGDISHQIDRVVRDAAASLRDPGDVHYGRRPHTRIGRAKWSPKGVAAWALAGLGAFTLIGLSIVKSDQSLGSAEAASNVAPHVGPTLSPDEGMTEIDEETIMSELADGPEATPTPTLVGVDASRLESYICKDPITSVQELVRRAKENECLRDTLVRIGIPVEKLTENDIVRDRYLTIDKSGTKFNMTSNQIRQMFPIGQPIDMFAIKSGTVGTIKAVYVESGANPAVGRFDVNEIVYMINIDGVTTIVRETCVNPALPRKVVVQVTPVPVRPTVAPTATPTEMPVEEEEVPATPTPRPAGGQPGGNQPGGPGPGPAAPTSTPGGPTETPIVIVSPTGTPILSVVPTVPLTPQTLVPTVATPGIGATETPNVVATPPRTNTPLPGTPTLGVTPVMTAQTLIPLVATPGIGATERPSPVATLPRTVGPTPGATAAVATSAPTMGPSASGR